MKVRRIGVFSSMALAIGGFVFFAAQSVALAGGFISSGTSYTVPIDVDGDGTGLSSIANYTGKGPGGQYTGQGISEFAPSSGAGCNMNGAISATQASCAIDGRTDGCLYEAEGGASENTYQGTFDIEIFERVPGKASTVCIDFSGSAPPYNTLGTTVDKITGGTGRFADKKGTITTQVQGQILTMDSLGNGFSWYKANGK